MSNAVSLLGTNLIRKVKIMRLVNGEKNSWYAYYFFIEVSITSVQNINSLAPELFFFKF